MPHCEFIATCLFFNDKMSSGMPLTNKVFKEKYCGGINTKCARYIIFRALGEEGAPDDLFPNQISRIPEIFFESERKACECLSNCLFFNDKMANMPATSEIYKNNYCKKDSSYCARYKVFKALGKDNVPKDLFPNQISKVHEIFNESQKSG
jgi:hypothetical protein